MWSLTLPELQQGKPPVEQEESSRGIQAHNPPAEGINGDWSHKYAEFLHSVVKSIPTLFRSSPGCSCPPSISPNNNALETSWPLRAFCTKSGSCLPYLDAYIYFSPKCCFSSSSLKMVLPWSAGAFYLIPCGNVTQAISCVHNTHAVCNKTLWEGRKQQAIPPVLQQNTKWILSFWICTSVQSIEQHKITFWMYKKKNLNYIPCDVE